MMNNIEILEEFIEKNIKSRLRTELNANELQAIENLIQENKELKEHLQKYYNGELYTAKQLKNIEKNQRKYFIHKSKVKELGEKVHNKLDNNAITRGYQIIIDEMFSKVLEEGE